MHFSPKPFGGLALSLAALGLAALAPAAQAQTQDLFVSNTGNNTISRFAGTGPGTFSTTATTLSGGLSNPEGLAFDTRGDLFAANFGTTGGNGSITEFAAGATPGTFGAGTTFATGGTVGNPSGLAFDARGDLFAANGNGSTITEFAFNAMTGTFGATTTLSGGGLSGPAGLAFDARGDLFAANFNNNTITEFAFNSASGMFGAGTTFASGLGGPFGLAFDARGDLFASNSSLSTRQGGNSITEFAFNAASGTFGAGTTFATGGTLGQPLGLAFDARGDLFAVNANGGSVTEFAFNAASGTFGAGTTVETGLSSPAFLAFGPSVPPAVPEASTTVSLGLLLALGLGGMVVAGKRRKA